MVVAKSSKDIKQLEHRKELGVFNIELQLLDFDVVDISKLEKDSGVNIVNVHTPLTKDYDFDIMDILEDNKYNYIRELFNCMNTWHKINVIVHYGKSCSNFDLLTSRIKSLLEINKNIDICIENLPMMDIDKKSGDTIINNFYYKGVIELIEKLRVCLSTNRIYAVLDTCHAIANINVNKDSSDAPHSLHNYFRDYAKYCNICHFADCVNYGLEPSEHGIGFKTYEAFERVYELHSKYVSNALLVIEMQEEDYMNCKNLKQTLEYIRRYKNE